LSLKPQQVRLNAVVRADRRNGRQFTQPPIEIKTVEVNHVESNILHQLAKLRPEAFAVVQKERVRTAGEGGSQVIEDLSDGRVLSGNQHWSTNLMHYAR